MNYYTDVMGKYADFTGRARRAEYWMFQLVNVIIVFALAVIEVLITGTSIISGLYLLAILLPSIAVACRRLHDTGKSGWLQLIGLIPLIGLVLFVFYIQDSDPGTNQYGPNPKGGPDTYEAFPRMGGDPGQRDVTGEPFELAALKDRGALTEEEFTRRKEALLGRS